MTTFTMQDLNTATPEEDEAFKALEQALENRKIFDNIQPATKEDFMEQGVIQGATGAQYTPIDFKQFEGQTNESKTIITAPPTEYDIKIRHQLNHLSVALNSLIETLLEQHKQQPQPVSEGLEETVDTVLQNADWFANKVDEKLDELIDDHDFDYEIERAVENHFGDFCLEDHVDVSSEIESIVDDRLDDMVQEKVEEILREKLSTATISFN